jgi:hypothetical protein
MPAGMPTFRGMGATRDLSRRRLEQCQSALVDVLATVRDTAEDLAVTAESVCRRNTDDRASDRLLVEAVRARDAIDEALAELQHRPGRVGTRGTRSAWRRAVAAPLSRLRPRLRVVRGDVTRTSGACVTCAGRSS